MIITLTIVKTQIGIFAGILDKPKSEHDMLSHEIYLDNPVAFEIMIVPSPGSISGSITFIPQWVAYKLHTSRIEINLSGPYFIYEILLDEDNFISNIYKRVMSQEKKSKLH